jgi:hypothetical protein
MWPLGDVVAACSVKQQGQSHLGDREERTCHEHLISRRHGCVEQLARLWQARRQFEGLERLHAVLRHRDGKTAAFDDDSGGNLNARLYFEADRPGYSIWVTTHGPRETGQYTLTFRKLAVKK